MLLGLAILAALSGIAVHAVLTSPGFRQVNIESKCGEESRI